MAFLEVDAVIAYVPGSMQKRCHYSIYLMRQSKKMWITAILSSRWYERER